MTTSWKIRPASDKAMGFLGALLRDRDWTGWEATVATIKANERYMTGAECSAYIEIGKSLPYKQRATAPTAERVTETGMYTDGTHIYRVQSNKAGTSLYAKRLVPSGSKSGWSLVYESGAIYKLTPAMRMTEAQVEAASAGIGACAVCGRTLTAKDSVKAGIGPVCITKI